MKKVLQKIIAASGLASRRQAAELIKQGLVKLNGRRAVLGDRAEFSHDSILIKGRPLAEPRPLLYFKLNKPAGYTCTNRVFTKEKNIFCLLPRNERLFSIGRLDKSSRGLLILTNDGYLAQQLAHPRFQHEKTYRAVISDANQFAPGDGQRFATALNSGVDIGEGDGRVKTKKAQYLQNRVFVITLSEGKKRQVRRMFAALNLKVTDLQRISFAGLDLKDLPEGKWSPLTAEEIRLLSDKKIKRQYKKIEGKISLENKNMKNKTLAK